MRRLGLVLALLLALLACDAHARAKKPAQPRQPAVPPQALTHLPTLVLTQRSIWPDAPVPHFLAGQVEQESCITLTHPRCWNPNVELKTACEYGFGLGQTTIAYDCRSGTGKVRFNKWAELRTRYPSLRTWTWENRFDAALQLTALVEMDKALYAKFAFVEPPRERLGFALSGYNGGEGATLQDRMLCGNTPSCDKNLWFNNVERVSFKSRVPNKGYGKSAFDINREYPHLVDSRMQKYQKFFTNGATSWNKLRN